MAVGIVLLLMFASLSLRQADLATYVEWIEIHFDIYICGSLMKTREEYNAHCTEYHTKLG